MLQNKCLTIILIVSLLSRQYLAQQPGITLTEVAQHDTSDDCWSAVYGDVYDLTAYAPNHRRGGGPSNTVYLMCGTDGTALYDAYHGDNIEWLTQISSIQKLGFLLETATDTATPTNPPETSAPTEPPVVITSPPMTNAPTTTVPAEITDPPVTATPTTHPATVPPTKPPISITNAPTTKPTSPMTTPPEHAFISAQELAAHSKPGTDCWVSYYDTVYNLTPYTHPDPPGNSVIACGLNQTAAFAEVHDETYLLMVQEFIVGTLVGEEPTEPEPESSDSYVSLQELQVHSSAEDCWVSYYGGVYNMTEYAPTHPSGAGIIFANCGWDGTTEYAEYHEQSLLVTVQQYYVGAMDPEAVFEEAPAPSVELTAVTHRELATHSTPGTDCWVAYYNEVYDLTRYGHPNPPGMRVIDMACGQDGTRNLTAVHPRDLLEQVADMKVGWLKEASGASRIAAGLPLALLSLIMVAHI